MQGRGERGGMDVSWKLIESQYGRVYQDLNMFTVKNTWMEGGK